MKEANRLRIDQEVLLDLNLSFSNRVKDALIRRFGRGAMDPGKKYLVVETIGVSERGEENNVGSKYWVKVKAKKKSRKGATVTLPSWVFLLADQ